MGRGAASLAVHVGDPLLTASRGVTSSHDYSRGLPTPAPQCAGLGTYVYDPTRRWECHAPVTPILYRTRRYLVVYRRSGRPKAYFLMRQTPGQLPVFGQSITMGNHRNDNYGYVVWTLIRCDFSGCEQCGDSSHDFSRGFSRLISIIVVHILLFSIFLAARLVCTRSPSVWILPKCHIDGLEKSINSLTDRLG